MASAEKVVGMIVAAIVVGIVAGIVVLFVVKMLWAWTIPDLFPGAVKEGLVAESISWMTSLKIAIFIAVLSAFANARGTEKHP